MANTIIEGAAAPTDDRAMSGGTPPAAHMAAKHYINQKSITQTNIITKSKTPNIQTQSITGQNNHN